jgi:hypothetical protein
MKFERKTGFFGSRSQKWIDETLKICPFCKTTIPKWDVGEAWTSIHFRCIKCLTIVSAPSAMVESSGSLLATAGLGGLLAKKITKRVKVECCEVLPSLRAKEFTIDELKAL